MLSEKEQTLRQTIIQLVRDNQPNSVKELIDLTKTKTDASQQEITDTILNLQNQEQITLSKPTMPTPESLATYSRTHQAAWFWITLVTSIATLASVFLIPEDAAPIVYIRYILGSIYVLWLPGYTFIRALFPITPSRKQDLKSLDTYERLALSIGMSLALVPLTGLLLNYTPWGIRLTPIVLALLALTLIFSTTALIREHSLNKKTKP